MTKLERLKEEVRSLEGDELRAFLAMIDELKWQLWDKQLEEDVAAGRLDHLAEEALADLEAGRTTPL